MKLGVCKFFTGTQNECCGAGVNYRQLVGGQDFGWGRRLPCMAKYADPETVVCEKRQEPTAEEVAKDEAESARAFEGTMLARAAIVKAIGSPWKEGAEPARGVCDCPVCKGVKTLRYSRASTGGHIHARCVTAGCVAWME